MQSLRAAQRRRADGAPAIPPSRLALHASQIGAGHSTVVVDTPRDERAAKLNAVCLLTDRYDSGGGDGGGDDDDDDGPFRSVSVRLPADHMM
uniref:Uncharacterized protein n=1 Tax=Plectus sambesii TaxID=2011161 RepID=A0A914UQH9_9BILA